MRKLAIGLLAATGLAFAVPANADSVTVGAGPEGVGVGVHNGYRHHYASDRDSVYVRDHRSNCRITIIHRHGEVERIRRCY